MARSDSTGIPVTLNLCLHISSLAGNSAKSAQNLPYHGTNLGQCWKQGAILLAHDG